MNDQRTDSPDKLLDDLESLQALLDAELDGLDIPVLSDVVDAGSEDEADALPPGVSASSLELDFEGFEVDEELLEQGLGLDEPAPVYPAMPQPAPPPPSPAPAATAPAQQLVLPPVRHLDSEAGRQAQPTLYASAEPAAAIDDDERVASLVEQCLAELEELLRPRLERLCRELLATGNHTAGDRDPGA